MFDLTLPLSPRGEYEITDAVSQLAAIQSSTDAVANIKRILTVVDYLQHVSIDTSAARADADRMLIYWQGRTSS